MHWNCCGWQKVTSRDEVMLNKEPIALAVIELRLSEGIRESVSQSVSRKICEMRNFLKIS